MKKILEDYEEYFLQFPKYVRRHEMARLIVQYELFKKVLNVKGSIIECGVYQGAGLLAWAKISEIMEPYNFLRKIYGFDTFEGFPSIAKEDIADNANVAKVGHLKPEESLFEELNGCIQDFENTRLLKHQEKISLIKGDALLTIPDFVKINRHVLVSLLYLDFDLYEPTLLALKEFMPRMPKGAIVAFDELHDGKWPGETIALLEALDIKEFKLEAFPFEPHISWFQIQ